jgi:hypothetical protein
MLPPQIVLNDKIPNPQGTTQGATVRMVTTVTSVTYPLHFRLALLRLKGVSLVGLLSQAMRHKVKLRVALVKQSFGVFRVLK